METLTQSPHPTSPLRTSAVQVLPGLLWCVGAVLVSKLVHLLMPAVPVMTVAVVLGVIVANLPFLRRPISGVMKPGLTFASKRLMRAGIVFLGLKLSIIDVLQLGWVTFAVIVAVVLLSFLGTYLLGVLFRLPGDMPLLVAAGFSICGASAIGAMSAARGSKHHDTVLPIALVTLCGTMAIVALPMLMVPLALDPLSFGRWVGISVHDVGQVVATAQVAGGVALSGALVFKLTRVVLLAPIVSVTALIARRSHRHPGADGEQVKRKLPPVIPLFVVGFVVMITARSTGWLSASFLEFSDVVQEILLGSALFGLGSAVRFTELALHGRRGGLMALCSWILIAGLGYLAIRLIAAY